MQPKYFNLIDDEEMPKVLRLGRHYFYSRYNDTSLDPDKGYYDDYHVFSVNVLRPADVTVKIYDKEDKNEIGTLVEAHPESSRYLAGSILPSTTSS